MQEKQRCKRRQCGERADPQRADADSGNWSFKTDSLGELLGWTDAKGQSFGASYDALGRMTSRTEPEGASTWAWGNSAASHNIGRLWKESGYGYVEELTYDGIGRTATRKITTDQAYQYDYSYNSIGAMDTIAYPSSPVPSGQTGTRFKARYYYSFGGQVSITDASDAAEKPLWALAGSNAFGSATSESLGGVATVTVRVTVPARVAEKSSDRVTITAQATGVSETAALTTIEYEPGVDLLTVLKSLAEQGVCDYVVDRRTIDCAKPGLTIMHPLPRDSRAQANELDSDLDENPNLAIFRQTDNGVLLRMALFALILDVADEVHNHARPVTWYTAKRIPRR